MLFVHKNKVLIAVLYGLILFLFVNSLHLNLNVGVTGRVRLYAIPIAISTLYQGHKHDYTGWRTIELPFQNGNYPMSDASIEKAIHTANFTVNGNEYWVADDRGFVDYVIGAFATFGPKIQSLFYLWFSILLLSTTLFIISFRRHQGALGFLGIVLLGINSAASLLKLTHYPTALFAPKFLEVLALVPIYHLICSALFLRLTELKKYLYPLLAQVFLFVFMYNARSSLGWEVLATILICSFVIIGRAWKSRGLSRPMPEKRYFVVPLLVAALLLGGLGELKVYKHLTYNKSYLRNDGVRTFWHNALMGIGAMPGYSRFSESDGDIANQVIQYARKSDRCPIVAKIPSGQTILNTLGGYGNVNWPAYESCARKLYLSIVLTNKWQAAKLYFYTKPLIALKTLWKPDIPTASPSPYSYLSPFRLAYLIPLCLLLLFSLKDLYRYRWPLTGSVLVMFAASMIPSVAFYTHDLTRCGMGGTVATLFYLLLSIVLYKIFLICKNLNDRRKVHLHESN